MIRAVIFDVDGVLLDSLKGHLQYCEDKNRKYGLGLTIPDAGTFRGMVRAGVKISPMLDFFLAVGFPPEAAHKADVDYRSDFVRLYPPPLYSGVKETLAKLRLAGLTLGIVTSNVRANIEIPLADCLGYFEENLIICKDSPYYTTKTEALANIVLLSHLEPSQILYVGDQPADAKAARDNKIPFLGVSYGWCFDIEGETDFPMAHGPKQIATFILDRTPVEKAALTAPDQGK